MRNIANRQRFWKGKKVLITGHTGFKGSWLSLWLQSLEADVVGYALSPPTEPNLFEVARVGQAMRSIRGDVRDLEHLQAVVREHRPEVVFHLAAQSLVRQAYEHPVETFMTNVIGTVHILEAIRQVDSTRAIVSVTSDKCYKNSEWVWGYRETDELGGHDPYSGSKGAAELAISAYRKSFFEGGADQHEAAVASARAGNVIGGGDWAKDRLVPDIMRAFMEGRPVKVRNPRATRPWQHVLEPLNGYLMLVQQLLEEGSSYAEGWNFGPDDTKAQPVSWLVKHMADRWGGRWELDEASHPHEDTYLKLDCSKARKKLGWSTELSLTTTLNWTVDWYQKYQQGADMRAFTCEQVHQYQNRKSPQPDADGKALVSLT